MSSQSPEFSDAASERNSNSRAKVWRLRRPVSAAPGVGPDRAELMEKLGIRTIADVLFCFPRDYEDLTKLSRVCQLQPGKKATVPGTIKEVELREFGEDKSILGVLLHDGSDYLRATWFNQPYMKAKFKRDQDCVFTGVPRHRAGRWEMNHPQVAFPTAEEVQPQGLLPVYPLTEGLNQAQMRHIVRATTEAFRDDLEEAFADDLRRRFDLMPIAEALQAIHRPENREQLARARRRFVFQELFVMQLALARRRQMLEVDKAPALPLSAKIRSRILRLFPFELTAEQIEVCEQLAADMGRDVPMNRLLQGDVGAGKTAVAAFAMLLAVAHGYQAVMVAPTEVLARQHARTLTTMLRQSNVRIDTLIGKDTPKQRADLLARIADGQVDLIVGTQAIAHAVQGGKMNMDKLGLVVVDEQHKFGVRQRALLKQAGVAPHYLVMTATPIPRTVTMSLFGDLDVSSLHGAPQQRKVHTYQGTPETRDRWWEFFAKKLREGRQGYVIAPVVDGGSLGEEREASLRSVEDIFEELAADVLEEFRIDLLHGRMNSMEKEDVMQRFSSGETQVLVATSIVEVGIDVPNATVMAIESANRFGLAQLHQLRGRVGRGAHPGYVCLFAQEFDERLEIFCNCNDGFQLAEEDFRLRGPGEILGTRQHGLPPLRIANLLRDQDTLEEARGEAQWLIEHDPLLEDPAHARLARLMEVQYGDMLDLGDVG